MRRLLSVLLLTTNILAQELELDILTMLQGNIGSWSQLTTVPASIKFSALLPVQKDKLTFIAGVRTVSGKTKLSGWSEYVPVNDIAFEYKRYITIEDRYSITNFKTNVIKLPEEKGVMLNNAYFIWKAAKKIELSFGVVNITHYGSKGKGLANSSAIGDKRCGFVSTHFLRPLALSSLEQKYYSSIPILGFDFWASENFNLRSYVTFGMTTEHIFFRNTWGMELNFKTSFEGNYTVHLGFADTEFSYTHHISPCILVGFDQKIAKSFGVFGRYSQTEKHKVSLFFTDVQTHYLAGIFFASDDKNLENVKHFVGFGISNVKVFSNTITETAIELFYRFAINPKITLTPDLQLIDSPNGNDGKLLLIWGMRFFCKI